MGLLPACSDPVSPPPTPGPPDLPRWSTAPHVHWAGLSTPVDRPLVVFVDAPGGPLDRLAADADVTTFLNDRFRPLFLTPDAAPELLAPSVQVLDSRGCWLQPPTRPETAAALVALGNAVLQGLHDGRPATARPSAPVSWGVELPAGHPLATPCPAP